MFFGENAIFSLFHYSFTVTLHDMCNADSLMMMSVSFTHDIPRLVNHFFCTVVTCLFYSSPHPSGVCTLSQVVCGELTCWRLVRVLC
jgi:hypothetical protein